MRRLALLLAVCAAIAGCDKAEDGQRTEVGAYSLFDPVAANPSLCGGAAIPFPNNALFSGTTDATLNIPNPASAPFVTAANLTDGFSTTASIFTDVLGDIDYTSAANAVVILETDSDPLTAGPQPRFLEAGVDFVVQPSTAMAQVSGTGSAAGACASTGLPARFLPISRQRSRLLIEPRNPLKPSTTYIVAVTKALKTNDGVATTPNEFFGLVNSDNKICDLTGAEAGTELDCSDPAAQAEAATRLNAPVLRTLSAPPTTAVAKMQTLETLRRSLIRPTVTALKSAYNATNDPDLADSDLVIAWSFTTQSVDLTLSRLNTNAAAAAFQVANTTISTGDLGQGLNDTADIYAGIIQVPYYLANTGGSATAPLTTSWTSTGTRNDSLNPPALGGMVPCAALAKSTSTTVCYPDPVANSTETIPVMVTVPNNNVCTATPDAPPLCVGGVVQKPAAGWPVVIFQHGITRNRTDMLAIAPTFASAGFVTVSIDQPLHGITNNSANPATNPFYRNQVFTSTPAAGLITGERTFDLDLVDNTPAAQPAIPTPADPCPAANNQPDMVIDSSGTHFVNLSSLIVARDNLRQAEADILHLARSIVNLDIDNNPAALTDTDIDESRIRFVGQSLGAIVGTTVLGTVDNTVIQAASLNVPGGGLGKLLDASGAFGPRIAAGLSCNFVYEGTDTYETFVRFAQHLIDPADPINYAAAANAKHPLHLVEVIGDAVVPNSAGSTCPAASALPAGIGATATFVDPPGTPPPATAPAAIAAVAASGAAGAALVAACPPTVLPADPPLVAITIQDETVITGELSGTDALIRVMGLTTNVTMGNAPFAAQTSRTADTVVQFAPDTAEHGTLLTPHSSAVDTADADTDPTNDADAAFICATREMQRQTATFLATNGAVLPIGGPTGAPCP